MADMLSAKTTTRGNLSKSGSKSFISKHTSKKLPSYLKPSKNKIGAKSINVKQFALLTLPHKVGADHRDDIHHKRQKTEKIESTIIKAPTSKKSKNVSGESLFDVRSKLSRMSPEKSKMTNAVQKSKYPSAMVDNRPKMDVTPPLSILDKKTTTPPSPSTPTTPRSPEQDINLLLNEPDVIISKSFQMSSDRRPMSIKKASAIAVTPATKATDSSRGSRRKMAQAPPVCSRLFWRQLFECMRNQSLVAWLTIGVLAVVLGLVIFYVVAAVAAIRAPKPLPPADYY